MAEKPRPVRVLYCSVCSLPAEYCEFGPDFEKCKPWLIENAPHLYPDLAKEAADKEAGKTAEQLQGLKVSGDQNESNAPAELLKCNLRRSSARIPLIYPLVYVHEFESGHSVESVLILMSCLSFFGSEFPET
eukprot:Gb_11239 [translate_table: standard]